MCGIIGIYNYLYNSNIINETYENFKKIQHRGLDSYGYVFINNNNLVNLIKNVNKIVKPNIEGEYNISLAHNKYTTSDYRKLLKTDEDMLKVTQPFKGINKRLGEFYLVHNGNIKDLDSLKNIFDLKDEEYLNDSHLLTKIVESLELQQWEDIFNQLILSIDGSFSILVATKNNIYAFKDLRAYRPLCIGSNERGYCLASESIGLGDYKYMREIERGEILKIGSKGIEKYDINVNLGRIERKSCLFEYIYFLNGESKSLNNDLVEQIRYQYGIELGKKELYLNLNLNININKSDKENCIVIGAPMTGIPSGKGFADFLGYRYEQILVKNKNAGRSFILKSDEERIRECKKKFIVENGDLMFNKEVFFLDDSLVRGNTLKVIISILKEYKPKKIHIRIASPKILGICDYGIDIPSREELIMNWNTNEEYVEKIGADSICFLELEDMYKIMGTKEYCVNCFKQDTKLEW
jgi:amidophosphoribosyltransferase